MAAVSLPLEGRIAIVAGGSRGIGGAISQHLRSLCAKLVINYACTSNQAQILAIDLNSNSDNTVAITVQADVANPDQVKMLLDRAEEAFGGPAHILVNCTGIGDSSYPKLADTSLEDWDKNFNVNTRGSFLCCQEAANRLHRGGGGRIIMITSTLVGLLLPGYGSYVASKAAVEAMTKILAKELKGMGITANCVATGRIAMELFFEGKTDETIKGMVGSSPLGWLRQSENMSMVIGFVASDAGESINGQVIHVKGRSSI